MSNDVVEDDGVARLMAQHEIERQIYQMGYHLEDGNFEGVAELLADATFGADILGRAAFRGRQEIRQQYERTNVTYPDRGRATKEIYSNILVDIDLEAGRARSVTSYTVAQQPPGESFATLSGRPLRGRMAASGYGMAMGRSVHKGPVSQQPGPSYACRSASLDRRRAGYHEPFLHASSS